MHTAALKQNLLRNLSNLPGWRTRRHIVVIESDDWGSIRMASHESFRRLRDAGLPVERSHYNRFDGLESDDDLAFLMETLAEFRDSTGRPPSSRALMWWPIPISTASARRVSRHIVTNLTPARFNVIPHTPMWRRSGTRLPTGG